MVGEAHKTLFLDHTFTSQPPGLMNTKHSSGAVNQVNRPAWWRTSLPRRWCIKRSSSTLSCWRSGPTASILTYSHMSHSAAAATFNTLYLCKKCGDCSSKTSQVD